jgi:hypothetical protein
MILSWSSLWTPASAPSIKHPFIRTVDPPPILASATRRVTKGATVVPSLPTTAQALATDTTVRPLREAPLRKAPPDTVTVLPAFLGPGVPTRHASGDTEPSECFDLTQWTWSKGADGQGSKLLTGMMTENRSQIVGNCGIPVPEGKTVDAVNAIGSEFCSKTAKLWTAYDFVHAETKQTLSESVRWDMITMLRTTWRHKTIAFCGDSMAHSQAFSLRCEIVAALALAGGNFTITAPSYPGGWNNPHGGGAFLMRIPAYNFTLAFLRFNNLANNNNNGTLDPMVQQGLDTVVPGADVTVYHTMAHIFGAYFRPNNGSTAHAWYNIFAGLSEVAQSRPGRVTAVRLGGIPHHFRCSEKTRSDQHVEGARISSKSDSDVFTENCWLHWIMAKLARHALRGAKQVVILDVWPIDFNRFDAHLGGRRGGGKRDCLHHCFPSIPVYWTVALFGRLIATRQSSCDRLDELAAICAGPDNLRPIQAFIHNDTIAAFNALMSTP